MKKHLKMNESELIVYLFKRFLRIEDLRLISIIAHQYIEYFLDEIICQKLKYPEFIVDNIYLGTFHNKFILLQSLGVLYGDKSDLDLVENIRLINEIRNFYAHNLTLKEEVPQEIQKKINKMNYLDMGKSNEASIKKSKDSIVGTKLHNQFEFKAKIIATIAFLMGYSSGLKGDSMDPTLNHLRESTK
jgi:hypothetical protein